MSISFNEIPINLRTPGIFVENDSSGAIRGLPGQPYNGLLIGQKLAAGTAAAEVPVLVQTAAAAKTLFGRGSMLAHMAEAWKKNDQFTPLWAIPVDDDGVASKGAGTVTFTGTATAGGTVFLYIGGRRMTVGVLAGQTAADVAASVNLAINQDGDLPVTSGQSAGVVTLTAKNGGVIAGRIDIALNTGDNEELPAGITGAVVAMSGGATDPDLSNVIAAMGDTWYNVIAWPYNVDADLDSIETELQDRAGPLRQIDAIAVTARDETLTNLVIEAQSRNSPFLCFFGAGNIASTEWEVAAAVGGRIARHGADDPARPLQTLELIGIAAPSEDSELIRSERNTLLEQGVSTFTVSRSREVTIERLVTTRVENDDGVPDLSLYDLNTLLSLSFLRFSLRQRLALRYPRHKLADDGVVLGPGQAIVTPKIAKAEIIALAREWEFAGIMEGIDQFKEDLLVVRSQSDVNTLEVRMSPDLVNQLRVTKVQNRFLL